MKNKLLWLSFLLIIGCTDSFDSYEFPAQAPQKGMDMIALDGGEIE